MKHTSKEDLKFTDDDLKRLKYILKSEQNSFHLEFYIEDAEALLARLEAAEEGAGLLFSLHSKNSVHHTNPCKICTVLNRWRKAAGK